MPAGDYHEQGNGCQLADAPQPNCGFGREDAEEGQADGKKRGIIISEIGEVSGENHLTHGVKMADKIAEEDVGVIHSSDEMLERIPGTDKIESDGARYNK